LPHLREDHPATGAVSCHRASTGRSEPIGDDPLRQVRRAPSTQPAEQIVCRRRHPARRVDLGRLVGACTASLSLLIELIRHHVFAAARLHDYDIKVPVLAKGKNITGRVWSYVRDDRRLPARTRRWPTSNRNGRDQSEAVADFPRNTQLRVAEPLRLEPAHLAGRSGRLGDRPVTDHPAHCRVAAQPLGVVHVLVAGQPPEHRLAQQAV